MYRPKTGQIDVWKDKNLKELIAKYLEIVDLTYCNYVGCFILLLKFISLFVDCCVSKPAKPFNYFAIQNPIVKCFHWSHKTKLKL